MLSWADYIHQLLTEETEYDSLVISLDGNHTTMSVPPIIKASILMLDEMLEHMGKRNMFVFPEKNQSLFIFVLMKLLHNIGVGKIAHQYDPETFKPGEKLKLGKAVVEFIGLETTDGNLRMKLRLADCNYSAPISYLPNFQRTDTSRRLSNSRVYNREKDIIKRQIELAKYVGSPVTLLAEQKSHMDSSIYYVSPVLSVKQQVLNCWLDDSRMDSLVLVGQANYEGTIQNIGPGQLKGIPAIVLASDLYAVNAAIEEGHTVQSIIIDASNMEQLLNQLDELDDLLHIDVPIVCVTDTANSFDLGALLERHFNVWRWDKAVLTPELYEKSQQTISRRIRSCANQHINYVNVSYPKLTEALSCLYMHKGDVQEQSTRMLKLFETLNHLTFKAMRETVGFSEAQSNQAIQSLLGCLEILESEKGFVPSETLKDYEQAINDLEQVYSQSEPLPKQACLESLLQTMANKTVAFIVPESSDMESVFWHWCNWAEAHNLEIGLNVMGPKEYLGITSFTCDAAIVVGWFSRDIMRKIIYGYRAEQCTVLLYESERRWCFSAAGHWRQSLTTGSNRTIIEKSFSRAKREIATVNNDETGVSPLPVQQMMGSDISEDDELEAINKAIRDSRYRRYTGNGQPGADLVEALPVNFIGDYIAFFRTGHKLISATKLIAGESDSIDPIEPEKLRVGDFIVMRETDRDLIREIADQILKEEGHANLRDLATKWKEAVLIHLIFNSPEEFYGELVKAGFSHGYQTVRNWTKDPDYIAPQSREDLELIALVTDDDVLVERIDQIHAASKVVKSAHIRAGRYLSDLLQHRIADELKKLGDIDPFNIWEPLEMEVEGIGTVRILKVIDVNDHRLMTVDATDTNRLLYNE